MFTSRGGKSSSVSIYDDVHAELDRIKYNLKLFSKIESDGAVGGLIFLLSKQVYALALVVERMYHDSI